MSGYLGQGADFSFFWLPPMLGPFRGAKVCAHILALGLLGPGAPGQPLISCPFMWNHGNTGLPPISSRAQGEWGGEEVTFPFSSHFSFCLLGSASLGHPRAPLHRFLANKQSLGSREAPTSRASGQAPPHFPPGLTILLDPQKTPPKFSLHALLLQGGTLGPLAEGASSGTRYPSTRSAGPSNLEDVHLVWAGQSMQEGRE